MHDPHGVVSRGPDKRKPPFNLLFHDGHTNCFGPSGTDEMRLGHHFPRIGDAKMYPADIIERDQVRLKFGNAGNVQQSFFPDLILGIEQALFPLRVAGTDGPVISGEKNKSGFMFGLQHLYSSAPAIGSYP